MESPVHTRTNPQWPIMLETVLESQHRPGLVRRTPSLDAERESFWGCLDGTDNQREAPVSCTPAVHLWGKPCQRQGQGQGGSLSVATPATSCETAASPLQAFNGHRACNSKGCKLQTLSECCSKETQPGCSLGLADHSCYVPLPRAITPVHPSLPQYCPP